MIIPEVIEYVNGTYCLSLDLEKLNDGVNRLNDILLNQQPRHNFRKQAEALLMRLQAKILAIKYFDGGYLEEDYLALKDSLSTMAKEAQEKEYAKTHDLLQSLLTIADDVHTAMDGAEGEIYHVRDDDGNPTTADQIVLKEFAENFKKRADSLSQLPDTLTIFGERVKMKDIKACAVQDLMEFVEWAESAIGKIQGEVSEQFFNENLTLLDDAPGLKFFDYAPASIDKDKNSAKTLVVLSPFEEEVVLFARAVAKEKGISFSIINAMAFLKKGEQFISGVFVELSKRGVNLIVKGLNDYNDQNKKQLIKCALYYSKEYGEIILVDDKGDRSVYDLAYEIAKEDDRLSSADVLYKYLTMPNYNFVISELEERGMINGSEYAYIQNNMAFMGYVGLNLACSLFVQGRPWKDDVKELSSRHESICQAYLRKLPSQSQLIDIGWKKLEIGFSHVDKKREFDYDSIKDIKTANIKKILEANISLFAKCGLVVKYCVLAGDDVSSWARVELSQRQERANNATRLLAHLLNCEFDPEVKIVPKDEWEVKGAGGLCCDGGKRILYREDCCDNVAYVMDVICHETFHSFQFTLQHQGWQKWHYEELGVTEYRVPEWVYNFERYITSSNKTPYMLQIVESDARAFAKDCIAQGESCWQLIDWE